MSNLSSRKLIFLFNHTSNKPATINIEKHHKKSAIDVGLVYSKTDNMQFSQCPRIIGRIVDDIFAREDIFFLLKNERSFFITFAFLFTHPNSDIFRRKAIKRIEIYRYSTPSQNAVGST